ncbi:MAG: hypothetical protein ACKVHE_22525 [Planctomycetales bacterium]
MARAHFSQPTESFLHVRDVWLDARLLSGNVGASESVKKYLIGALVVAVLSVTTHTLATGLAPMFYFAILVSLIVCRAKISRRFMVNGLSLVAVVCAYVLFYALPHIRGNWTGGDNGWLYSPTHALMTIPGTL